MSQPSKQELANLATATVMPVGVNDEDQDLGEAPREAPSEAGTHPAARNPPSSMKSVLLAGYGIECE